MEQQIAKYQSIQEFSNGQLGATLTQLQLIINKTIIDEDLKILKSCLSQCTGLQVFKLNIYSELEGHLIKMLFEDLPSFENLTSLSFQILTQFQFFNQSIQKIGAFFLGQYLKKQQNLKTLNLKLNHINIQAQGVSSLTEAINQMKNLENLKMYLGANQIGDKGAESIALCLSNCNNLINLELYLFDNQLSVQGISSIAKSLSHLTKIQKFGISLLKNEIGDEGALAISQALSSFKNLRELLFYLNCEKITQKGYLILDQCISGLTNLLKMECNLSKQSKLLKSNEILNCKNIKVLKEVIEWNLTFEEKQKYKQHLRKIRRLVKI